MTVASDFFFFDSLDTFFSFIVSHKCLFFFFSFSFFFFVSFVVFSLVERIPITAISGWLEDVTDGFR